jgi:hypothetical protein
VCSLSLVPDANESHHSQWFQYPDAEWEDAKNVNNAKKLVKKFWADLNVRVDDFDGKEVHASDENIGEWFRKFKFHHVIKSILNGWDAAKYKKFFIQNETVL